MTQMHLTSLTHQEDDWYVALCPEFDIASQGETPELAKQNLTEALELFFETASETEIERRFRSGPRVDAIELSMNRKVGIGETAGTFGA